MRRLETNASCAYKPQMRPERKCSMAWQKGEIRGVVGVWGGRGAVKGVKRPVYKFLVQPQATCPILICRAG